MNGPATFWRTVFGNRRPVEIEIGPGRGDVLLAFASARPDTNFFAIEHATGLAEALAAEAAARGLTNLLVVAGDARCVLGLAPPSSVATVHLYFPDPWPKTRHRHRRLFERQDLADAIARVLVGVGDVRPAGGEKLRGGGHDAWPVRAGDEQAPAGRGRSAQEWPVSPPVAAGGRDSSASEVIVSWPRADCSSTSVASSSERA